MNDTKNMKEKKHNNIKPAIMLSVVAAVSLAAVVALGWYVNTLRERLVVLSQEVAAQMVREKQADALGNFLDDIVQEEVRVRSFFISRNDVVRAIETIEGLGSAVGAEIVIAEVQAVNQTQENPGTLSMRLGSTGSWFAMTQLLALLEHLPFHAEISQVSLGTGSGGGTGPAVWSLQAVLTSELSQ